MKFIFATLALAATAFAASSCKGGQTAVCKGNGNGGLLTLGNVAPGALGEACSGGDVYCCDDKAIGDVRPARIPSLGTANNLPLFLGWSCEP